MPVDKQRVLSLIAKILRVPPETVTIETTRKNLVEWDSMNHLLLLTELGTAFGVLFTPDEVSDIKSVKDILSILERRT